MNTALRISNRYRLRWRQAGLLGAGLLSVASLLVLGCGSLPGKPKPGPEVPRPDSIMDFASLYRENCRACHGDNGVNGPSYPLANPTYQALVDDQTLHAIVANGLPGTLMPGFGGGGGLTDPQVNAVVRGMRAAWSKPDALAGANPPPYRATKTANPQHGGEVYATYCAGCHGAPNSTAKSKAGSITDPTFLALISDQGLRTLVIAGRPDIGQPDWRNDRPGHPMTDQEITDVIGWLAGKRPGASGTTPKSTGGTGR